MDFQWKRVPGVLLLLLAACQPAANENVRGKTPVGSAIGKPDDNSDDANSDPNAPVIVDGSMSPPLKLAAEVDQSALPAGFIEDIFAVHKIDATKTLLFGKSRQSWLLDEAKEGMLIRQTVDFSTPAGTSLYVMENKNFWLIGKSSVAFPSTIPSTDAQQITLINLTPDLLKDPANVVRVLHAGPQRLILATDKRANIVMLEGDKARVIALDFPKMGENPVTILSAGMMQNPDSFWFLSSDRILLLKKNAEGQGEGQWRWLINRFKLDSTVPPDLAQVAMVIDSKDDRSFNFIGRTFELAGGKMFEQNPFKLSLDIDPVFQKTIQPLLKTYCTPCHAGYEDYAVTRAKASAFRMMIMDGSMPKNMALTPEQIKLLTDYMSKVLNP